MASFWYDEAARAIPAGEVDLDGGDIRAALLMSNTTAGTERDKATLSAFTALDECNGAGYARVALTSKTVTKDTVNHRGQIDAADVTFSLVGASTRQVVAVLIYKHMGADGVNVPLCYIDNLTGFPCTPNGADIYIQWASAGYGLEAA